MYREQRKDGDKFIQILKLANSRPYNYWGGGAIYHKLDKVMPANDAGGYIHIVRDIYLN